ncbi:MAG: hypothetical protein IPK25_19370 [Saprospiraceae bacterium]|nr:hypothetical protein [Saprospiraceae bacterium]
MQAGPFLVGSELLRNGRSPLLKKRAIGGITILADGGGQIGSTARSPGRQKDFRFKLKIETSEAMSRLSGS